MSRRHSPHETQASRLVAEERGGLAAIRETNTGAQAWDLAVAATWWRWAGHFASL